MIVKSGSQYVLCEVSQRSDVAVLALQSSAQNTQSQVSPLGVWLTQYTSAAHVHTYVSGV